MARRLMMDLASRLVLPGPQDWQSDTSQQVVQGSTNGLAPDPEPVDLAFGPYVKYGTIVKDFHNADRKPGNYIVGVKRKARFGVRDDEMDKICTSHIERHNLTIRTLMKRFTRLSLRFSKKLENLAAASALHFTYYKFCRRPRHTDQREKMANSAYPGNGGGYCRPALEV